MKKIAIATAALAFMCGSALAQSTGAPAAAQSDMNKPGMNNSGAGMNNGANTTGTGMQKDGMSGDGMMKKDNMNQGGASKDGMGQMNKGGTSK